MSWLADTRTSYDTAAPGYAERFAAGLAGHPYVRGVLALFAELVRDTGGPVLDAGCGIGVPAGYLRGLGVDVFGVDLSPAMVAIARRDNPGLRFDVGSMTALDVPDASVGGVLAFYSLHHVPDGEVPAACAEFHRVLRPGGVVLAGFHVGDEYRFKTEGYGYPTRLHIHLRPVERMAGWLRDAGFTVEAEVLLNPGEPVPGGVVVARRAGVPEGAA